MKNLEIRYEELSFIGVKSLLEQLIFKLYFRKQRCLGGWQEGQAGGLWCHISSPSVDSQQNPFGIFYVRTSTRDSDKRVHSWKDRKKEKKENHCWVIFNIYPIQLILNSNLKLKVTIPLGTLEWCSSLQLSKNIGN